MVVGNDHPLFHTLCLVFYDNHSNSDIEYARHNLSCRMCQYMWTIDDNQFWIMDYIEIIEKEIKSDNLKDKE